MLCELLETCEMAKLAQNSRNHKQNATKRPLRRSNRLQTVLVCGLIVLINIAVIASASSEAGPQKSPASVASAAETRPIVAQSSAVQESDLKPKSTPTQTQVDSQAAKTSVEDKSTGERKARAESETPAKASSESSSELSKPTAAAESAPKPTESNATKPATSKPTKQQTLSGKSASQSGKSKLPANLGTVTSTGSGGPTHYLSKHDAYSAIAEKHGSLAQVTSGHKKSDSRRASSSIQRFGGIQKASGIGDMLSPFKGVTDSGLARTLGASMRSIMKSKYSVPAYVASALLGAVALMAFYESPMSPLPVPALPEPPIGRFPPEMPNISPNINAPFRTNGAGNGQYYGQNYNQRSSPAGIQQQPQQGLNYNNQLASASSNQQQQVLFPGSSSATAQQRSQASAGLIGGQVQQMAANLLSVSKQQNAQRKSGPDFDPTMARSFLSAMAGGAPSASNGNPFGIGKMSSGSSGQKSPAGQSSGGNSFLSYFGLGGSSSPTQASGSNAGSSSSSSSSSGSLTDSAGMNSNGALATGSSSLEPKAQLLPSSSSSATPSLLSGSHVVNKVKSMFSRAPVNQAAGATNSNNLYDQYARMSFVQALMKDTAFLPAFLSPSRKSSTGPSGSSSSSTSAAAPSAASRLQSLASAISSLAPQSQSSASGPAARMQVDGPMIPLLSHPLANLQAPQPVKQRATSGHGLMRAADRLARVLLETFGSGFMQKGAAAKSLQPVPQPMSAQNAERKSSESASSDSSNQSQQSQAQQSQGSPLVSATSLLSDIVSSYSNEQLGALMDSMQGKSAPQQPASSSDSSKQSSSQSNQATPNGRSSDESSPVSSVDEHNKQQAAKPAESSSSASSAPLSRKTRSVGFQYPNESDQMIAFRQQQQQQYPSRATQINNFVDYVSDSYSQNKLLFNFVMNQVGLGHAVPYVEQILASGSGSEYQH